MSVHSTRKCFFIRETGLVGEVHESISRTWKNQSRGLSEEFLREVKKSAQSREFGLIVVKNKKIHPTVASQPMKRLFSVLLFYSSMQLNEKSSLPVMNLICGIISLNCKWYTSFKMMNLEMENVQFYSTSSHRDEHIKSKITTLEVEKIRQHTR